MSECRRGRYADLRAWTALYIDLIAPSLHGNFAYLIPASPLSPSARHRMPGRTYACSRQGLAGQGTARHNSPGARPEASLDGRRLWAPGGGGEAGRRRRFWQNCHVPRVRLRLRRRLRRRYGVCACAVTYFPLPAASWTTVEKSSAARARSDAQFRQFRQNSAHVSASARRQRAATLLRAPSRPIAPSRLGVRVAPRTYMHTVC